MTAIGSPIGPIALRGAAFFSTHHASAADVLTGRTRPVAAPAYALLVGRARRFTSLVTQMHLEVCGALGHDAADPPLAVFATCHGEIQTAEKLVADFRDAAMVSSARFALSVHNTASGMYSVAVGSTAATMTVTGANAIAAGWLEAALTVIETGRSVLLSIADEPVPAIFQGPSEPVGVAAAFLLGPGRGVELAITRTSAAIDPLQVLARVADGAIGEAAAPVVLGQIQPGAALVLRFSPQAARA
ncbi:MAG: beta-ketoacyl synthase chain length factor [Kofleriaceae bacterium]